MDNDLDDLLDELISDDVEITESKKSVVPREETSISVNNIEETYLKKMGELFDSGQTIIRELQDRIEEGDTFEGTITGYTQTLTAIKGLVDTAQKPVMERKKQEHQIKMESIKAENRKREIELKNEGKAQTGNHITQNNIYTGGGGFSSLMQTAKAEGIEVGDLNIIDLEEEETNPK